jgi:hypothetical protein
MSRSQQASRFGALVEQRAADRYGLQLDHSELRGVRVDARDTDGTPFDIKGAMSNRKTGPGRFRLWKDQHDVLTASGGGYVFVWYQGRSSGVGIHDMRSIAASDISLSWGGSGDHRRNSQQAKIRAAELF